MKMISRRDFLKASAVVGATAAMTACGGSFPPPPPGRRSDRLRRLLQLHCCFLHRCFFCSCFF